MILIVLIAWILIGSLLAWLAGRRSNLWPRFVSLGTLLVALFGLVAVWVYYFRAPSLPSGGPWFLEVDLAWIPQLGIRFHLAMDGLSLLLTMLALFLGIMAVGASWAGIQERVGFFHFNLLWVVASLLGVFLALDLFLFYFFWEMMLVPLYFLIGIWGHENRVYATLKFFIFTQFSSLLMLLAILGLYFIHGQSTGAYTFGYFDLLGASGSMVPATAFWLMMGFFVAFGVKLPVLPVHTWLPDAHTEAPTAGSVDLAGLVLKVGAYGFIRFVIPLFPNAALSFANVAMALGVAGIVYGALMAFAQTNVKRLVAYTSISHMGFVLLGIFAWNQLALQGAVMVMLAHGVSTGALFILVGDLQERIRTFDMDKMGGLWSKVPRMGASGMMFALASLGLPGLGNFVGEFLVLLGVYQVSPVMAILAAIGFVVSTVYSLWMMQRVFFGRSRGDGVLRDYNFREGAIMGALVATIVWLGLHPQPVLNTARQALEALQQYSGRLGQVTAVEQIDRAAPDAGEGGAP